MYIIIGWIIVGNPENVYYEINKLSIDGENWGISGQYRKDD
jgi:hypothetical protein